MDHGEVRGIGMADEPFGDIFSRHADADDHGRLTDIVDGGHERNEIPNLNGLTKIDVFDSHGDTVAPRMLGSACIRRLVHETQDDPSMDFSAKIGIGRNHELGERDLGGGGGFGGLRH